MQHGFLRSLLEASLTASVRLCLRHGGHLQDLIEAAKAVFIREAESQLLLEGRKLTTSQLSLMTGLQRRDVRRVQELNRLPEPDQEAPYPQGLLTRVIGQWQYDRRYSLEPGKARALALSDISPHGNSVRELVASISSDVNPGTVLKELIRLNQVVREGDTVRLTVRSYTPVADPADSLKLFAEDNADLLDAVEENLTSGTSPRNLHAKTEFDNIGEEEIRGLRSWLVREGMALHARVRTYLSTLDRDLIGHGPRDSKRYRVALGTFSFITPYSRDTHQEGTSNE